jgi:hypothetical protein
MKYITRGPEFFFAVVLYKYSDAEGRWRKREQRYLALTHPDGGGGGGGYGTRAKKNEKKR